MNFLHLKLSGRDTKIPFVLIIHTSFWGIHLSFRILSDSYPQYHTISSLVGTIFLSSSMQFHLRHLTGEDNQKSVLFGTSIGFAILCVTLLTLRTTGAINAIPPIIATGCLSILCFFSQNKLKAKEVENSVFCRNLQVAAYVFEELGNHETVYRISNKS